MATADLVRLATLLEGLHAHADDAALPAIEEVARYVARALFRRGVAVDVVDPEGRI